MIRMRHIRLNSGTQETLATGVFVQNQLSINPNSQPLNLINYGQLSANAGKQDQIIPASFLID